MVRVIDAAKKEYYSETLAIAAPAEEQKCLKDLLYSAEQRLPPHDSEQELADSFVQFFHSTSSPARVSAHGGRDPGKPAWSEHFLKLAALIINELSLFGYTNNCACYKC